MKRLDDVLEYGLKIYQDDNFFSFSIDSVILANYSKIRLNDNKIIDLCSGNGIVPLILSKRTNKSIDCIEIQDKLYELLLENIKINSLENQIHPFKGDIKTYFDTKYNNYYDVVLCNPPYFINSNNSAKNLSVEKRIARHEVLLNFDELCFCVRKLLKNNGAFYLVHRTDRLYELLTTLKKYNLMPKRMFFVHENPNKNASMVFIESKFNGNEQLIVEKPFFVRNLDGNYSSEYRNIIKEVLK